MQVKKKMPLGMVRVIGGQWRGRKISVIDSQGLRPTTDRVKETLFNWLAPVIRDADCLDCFAGSGSLGIEALSRYAGSVCFLESSRGVAEQIKRNIAMLNCQNAQVLNVDALKWLAQKASKQFDVIFLDPPFRKGLLQDVFGLLDQNYWLKSSAWIYVECEVNSTSVAEEIPFNWHLHREKVAGQVSYRLYRKVCGDVASYD